MSPEFAWWVGAPLMGGGIVTLGVVLPRLRGLGPALLKESGAVLPLRAREAVVEVMDNETQRPSEPDPAPRESIEPASASATGGLASILRPAFGRRIATGLRAAVRRRRWSATPDDELASSSDELVAVDLADRSMSSGADDQEASVLRALDPTPAEAFGVVQNTADVPTPAENGIIALDAATDRDGDRWQGEIAEREQLLRAQTDAIAAQRADAAREEQRREAEVAAHRRQIEIENIAIAEDVRVRSEARVRKWFARLDLDLDVPAIEERMLLASSLGPVRASWAGKLLRLAFSQEEDERVRARIIGALVAGDHLDVLDPFAEALARGGLERAATVEVLAPRQKDAPWIAALLAPVLVA